MKVVILDRDGVINEEAADFVKSVAEFKPIPGSLQAIARMCHAGYRVFVASNQSGIGRGLFDYDALFAIHDKLQRALVDMGGRVEGIAYAPEHPDKATPMRKPGPGMLLDIGRRLGVSLERVHAVGDSVRDIDAAVAARARPVLVRTGFGKEAERDLKARRQKVPTYDNLAAFAAALIGGSA